MIRRSDFVYFPSGSCTENPILHPFPVTAVQLPIRLIPDNPQELIPDAGRACCHLLHAIHGSWCRTVVIVSHDMDEVAENCTRAAVFEGGRVVMCGAPAELFRRADQLIEMGLDVPTTAHCARILRSRGIDVESDFTCDDFAEKVLELWRAKGGAGRAQ